MTTKKALKEPAKAGRKTTYSDDVANAICERIADGESLVSICSDANMPCRAIVYDWLRDKPLFSDRYARAREDQADFYAEQIIQIADDGKNDSYVDDSGKTMTDQDVVARSRLRIDARKWAASKLAPKKYGDKVDVGVSGEVGLTVTIQRFSDDKDANK